MGKGHEITGYGHIDDEWKRRLECGDLHPDERSATDAALVRQLGATEQTAAEAVRLYRALEAHAVQRAQVLVIQRFLDPSYIADLQSHAADAAHESILARGVLTEAREHLNGLEDAVHPKPKELALGQGARLANVKDEVGADIAKAVGHIDEGERDSRRVASELNAIRRALDIQNLNPAYSDPDFADKAIELALRTAASEFGLAVFRRSPANERGIAGWIPRTAEECRPEGLVFGTLYSVVAAAIGLPSTSDSEQLTRIKAAGVLVHAVARDCARCINANSYSIVAVANAAVVNNFVRENAPRFASDLPKFLEP